MSAPEILSTGSCVPTQVVTNETVSYTHLVAINKFYTDTDAELNMIAEACKEYGVNVALSDVWGRGGEGGKELAAEVLRVIEEEPNHFRFSYADDLSLKEKILSIVRNIYGGSAVVYESTCLLYTSRCV